MSLETAALNHTCNVIKRQITEEFPDLNLTFVIYNTGGGGAALKRKAQEININWEDHGVSAALKKSAKIPKTHMAGIFEERPQTLLKKWRKKKFHAVFFVNLDDFGSAEDAEQNAYMLTWNAFSLLALYKDEKETLYKKEDHLICPAFPPLYQARENLLADTFSALIRLINGQKNAITRLARQRCEMAVTPIPYYKAEYHPFPIAIDAAKLVYQDLEPLLSARLKPVVRAINMTKEVNETYDNASIHQWTGFATAAQEMAWGGFDKNTILSAATYTSEDPYIRPIAYIIAEELHLDPAPLNNSGIYNPFTDQEANERLHARQCKHLIQKLLSSTLPTQDVAPFFKEAEKQNLQLIKSKPVGWCAPAMMEIARFLQNTDLKSEAPSAIEERALALFSETQKDISWPQICLASRLFLNRRRHGLEPDTRQAADILLKNEKLSIIGEIFLKTLEALPEETATPTEQAAS